MRDLSLGRHGISLVAETSGMNKNNIYKSIHELKSGDRLSKRCVRRTEGRNMRLLDKEPVLLEVFDNTVKARTARFPQNDSIKCVKPDYCSD